MFDYKNRVVVMTGASSGLGKQMARGFAQMGANLVLMARRIERLEDFAQELKDMGVEALPIKCDVTNVAEVNEAAKIVEENLAKLMY